MDTTRQTSRALLDEHRTTLDILARAGRALASLASGSDDVALIGAVVALDRHLRHDVERHFAFEERELFPRMTSANDAEMATLLLEEHETMRAVVAQLLPLSAAAAAGNLDADRWKALQRVTAELSERLVAHIEMEDNGLLPLIDELIDEDADRELALAYASS